MRMICINIRSRVIYSKGFDKTLVSQLISEVYLLEGSKSKK